MGVVGTTAPWRVEVKDGRVLLRSDRVRGKVAEAFYGLNDGNLMASAPALHQALSDLIEASGKTGRGAARARAAANKRARTVLEDIKDGKLVAEITI